uniref:Putative membrane protein n=1 Tax=uncultured bacterium contig00046 TaxID=1181532 RepID=A0A806KFG0_9BACT|nr:putative membrane protein [uncultured bacterium contig00046]
MFKSLTKEEKSWIFYDWANSAYTLTITSTIMGLYFLKSATAAIPAVTANAYWGFGNTIATIIVGLLAPILGTIADYKGKKKMFFNFFLFMGLISTLTLALVPSEFWWMLLAVYIVSAIGFSGANVFYDSFVVDVTEDKKMDWISSLGYGMGYIGSTIPFVLCMALVVFAEAYKTAFIVTALWWLVFSIPIMKNVHQKYGIEPEYQYIRKSFKRIWSTLKEIKSHKPIFTFLIAYFLYADGVNTIIKMATTYGRTIGIGESSLLLILLATQFVAFPFAIIYGKMANRFGTKRTIYFGIGTYCFICFIALFMSPDRDQATLTVMFWIVAMLVGTAQGGIQALSRSYFGRIIPKEKANEFFGFYNIFGRFAAVMGTSLFGVISLATGKPNYGIAGIIILFIAAGVVFRFVPDLFRQIKYSAPDASKSHLC